MSRIQSLQDTRATLVAESLAAFAGKSSDLTDEDRAQDDERSTKIDVIDSDIKREKRRQRWEAEQQAIVDTPAPSGVTSTHDNALDKPWGEDNGGYPFGDFLQAVARAADNGPTDPRLLNERAQFQAAAAGAGEAIGSEGGFLVRQNMMDDINLRMSGGEILSRVQTIPLSGNSNGVKINVNGETSRATGSRFGGVQGYWVDEGVAPTASQPTFHRLVLELKKIAALGYATEELLADASALESVMSTAFSEELRFLVEDAIVNGTGAGKPEGILNADCTVSVAKETSQAATTIVWENIVKMWARMYAPLRRNAIWLINQDIEPELYTMGLSIGTGGVPVYLPPSGASGSPYASLFGRPVIPSEYCQTLGTAGDIYLAAFSEYAYITKGGVQGASSMHVRFTTDEMAFRATYRADGKAKWKAALTPYKGSNTLSPFVNVAVRS